MVFKSNASHFTNVRFRILLWVLFKDLSANLYELQTRVLHHDSFLSEVATIENYDCRMCLESLLDIRNKSVRYIYPVSKSIDVSLTFLRVPSLVGSRR